MPRRRESAGTWLVRHVRQCHSRDWPSCPPFKAFHDQQSTGRQVLTPRKDEGHQVKVPCVWFDSSGLKRRTHPACARGQALHLMVTAHGNSAKRLPGG